MVINLSYIKPIIKVIFYRSEIHCFVLRQYTRSFPVHVFLSLPFNVLFNYFLYMCNWVLYDRGSFSTRL